MFIVFLKFSENKAQLKNYLDGHKSWIQEGYKDDVFLVSGSMRLEPQLETTPNGGCVLAHNCTLDELKQRLAMDPFVKHKVVDVEITEVMPSNAHSTLSFLINPN